MKFSLSTDCPTGRWGVMCDSACECQHSSGCDKVGGECICQPGWFGPKCSEG